MILGEHARVPRFAYQRPVDMRKSFESLAALVREVPGHDPLSGALYLFTNRRRRGEGAQPEHLRRVLNEGLMKVHSSSSTTGGGLSTEPCRADGRRA